MNTTNNTESTVSTPPLSKTPFFQALSIDGRGGATIAFLSAVVVVLCAMVFCSPEDLWNAGWHVGYYGSILLWCLALTVPVVAFIATSPLTVGRTAVSIQNLLTTPWPRLPELNPGLSIAPDELIRFDSPEESPATFKAKGLAFLHIQNREIWGLAVGYQQRRALVIRSDGTTIEYDRNAPPWLDKEDWTPARNYKNETWAEYDADLEQDKRGYLAWVVGAKTEHADGIQKPAAFFEAFTSVFLPLLFVFLSAFTLNAQPKSAQVAQYVGPENFQKIKITGAVVFRFQKLPIERMAKAQTLAQILSDARTYSDEDNAGKLQEITLNGFPIPRNMQRAEIHAEVKEMPDTRTATRAEIAKFLRPAQRDTAGQPIPTATGFESLTADSLTIAGNMNAARQKVDRWKRAGWAAALPVWEFFMYVFGLGFGILLCVGGICWYVADSATDETYIGYRGQTYTGKLARSAHESAAGWLLLITWTCFIVLLINVFLWLVYAGLDMWLVVVIWFIVLAISSKITKKIVPNIKRLSGETGVQRA